MELITELNDPRIHPDKVERIRNGARQEFRFKSKRSFDGDFYIDPPENHFHLEWQNDTWEWINGCSECNGKPRDWMTYIECEKHNVCRTCQIHRSKTEVAWGGKNGWQCQCCHDADHEYEKEAALAAMPEEYDSWDFHGKDEITCPYCAYEFSDSWENAGADDEAEECPRCDNTFVVTAVHSLTFNCDRLDD